MMNVSLEEAYREACLALGEAIVRERLVSIELAKLAAAESDQQPRPVGDAKPRGASSDCSCVVSD